MLRRFLEKIEQEVRIVLSEEESESERDNISDSAKRELEHAEQRASALSGLDRQRSQWLLCSASLLPAEAAQSAREPKRALRTAVQRGGL